MPSRWRRSTDGPPRSPRHGPGVEVYLLPTVVGGGLGDIEEVLAAGRRLARAGFPLRLYRRPGRPLPPGVRGPWDWPPHRRVARLLPRAPAALTVTAAWGISAAPSRPGALGRPGPWADEVADIETAYGPDQVLHVSLEEFARTLVTRAETRERLREGGIPARALAGRLRDAERRGELETFRTAYTRFRAFDRKNVLPLFATFRCSAGFRREFPQAVQAGPLWPRQYRTRGNAMDRPRSIHGDWVWYASPASAERIAPKVLEGLEGVRPAVHLYIRSPRPWRALPPSDRVTFTTEPIRPREWHRRFAAARVRIVTGSRTLLEALEVGGPFLYFNGILGRGSRMRRHRPEKIVELLEVARRSGVPPSLRRDLARFAQGIDVAGVVRRIAHRSTGWEQLRASTLRAAFPPPFEDAGALLTAIARSLARDAGGASELVQRVRRGVVS